MRHETARAKQTDENCLERAYPLTPEPLSRKGRVSEGDSPIFVERKLGQSRISTS